MYQIQTKILTKSNNTTRNVEQNHFPSCFVATGICHHGQPVNRSHISC